VLERLQEGAIVKGVVKNLTDYGAFVDLGGIDGLLHITDMAWKRVRHPSEVVKSATNSKCACSSSIASATAFRSASSSWAKIRGITSPAAIRRCARVFGKVSNVTDYGCFVEIEPGVEGLVHVSEMDWTNKNVNPSKVVQVGDEVEVMVLDVDEERRRISLGIKQCTSNPWEAFAAIFKKNDKVSGQIKSITDFGIFIGLDGGIDGLVHLSDISWNIHWRRHRPQLQEGRHGGSRGAGGRSGARAHLARHQAARTGSVRSVHGRQSQGQRAGQGHRA
jgi:small subunit ribosomal protein S1